MNAIGLVEFNSIARGIAAADIMVKTAAVELLAANPICPGKYMALVGGDVAAVSAAVKAGVAAGGQAVVDDFVLPNVHPAVFPAITASSTVEQLQALGIIETFTVASLIVAADQAAKAAEVELIEIRLAAGLGGKSYVTLTGDVAAVKAAVEAGAAKAADQGLLIDQVVIPSPAGMLKKAVL
ncbi:MAG: BMC domain-containing protein [Desulfurispora sp.]|uniref:BMC domain-containing protein n=1 Tax=Desulfurispora sp. TaxID=3014275 RepID=UPI00404946FA